jgi:hypothetical protein
MYVMSLANPALHVFESEIGKEACSPYKKIYYSKIIDLGSKGVLHLTWLDHLYQVPNLVVLPNSLIRPNQTSIHVLDPLTIYNALETALQNAKAIRQNELSLVDFNCGFDKSQVNISFGFNILDTWKAKAKL